MRVQFTFFSILVVVCLKQLPLVLDRFYKLNPNLSDFFGQSKVFENVINFILGKNNANMFFFSTGGGVVCEVNRQILF